MKNDYRADGSQSLAGCVKLTDQGVNEARGDLSKFFYDWANYLTDQPGDARILAELLADDAGDAPDQKTKRDIAEAIWEGLRDREKDCHRDDK